MAWDLDFISEEDFKAHVRATIVKYGENLESYDLRKFNKNLVDPIKLIFDKSVYQSSWDEIVKNELFRQRDKSNNNEIGYFHQNIFAYFKGCEVPSAGWDVIYHNPEGIWIPDGEVVHTLYVEIKNKHNTLNSPATQKIYIKMQSQILNNKDCACFLVETISSRSKNVIWNTSVDGSKVHHKLIRRVSMDQFYSLITGEKDAFYRVCMALPDVINSIVKAEDNVVIPHDTVIQDLRKIASLCGCETEDLSMAIAIYMLGFSTYYGFEDRTEQIFGTGKNPKLKYIYDMIEQIQEPEE